MNDSKTFAPSVDQTSFWLAEAARRIFQIGKFRAYFPFWDFVVNFIYNFWMSNKENKQSERDDWISRIKNVERETKKISERQVVFQVSSKNIICQILRAYITETIRKCCSSLCALQQSTRTTRQCWHCSPIELGISATRTNSSSWWATTTSLSSARDFGSFGRCSYLIRNSSCKKSTKDWSE